MGIPVPADIPDPTHGYGSGRVDAPRVRVGSGRFFTGTGIPAFTREKSYQVTQLLG